MSSFLYFWKFLDKKILYIFSSLFNSINGLLYSVIFAQTTQMLLSYFLKDSTSRYNIVLIIFIPIVAVLFGYYTTYTSKIIKVLTENNLKRALTKKILYSNKSEYDIYGKEKIFNQYLYDIQSVSNILVTKISSGMINPIVTVLGSIVLLVIINYKLFIFASVFAVLTYLVNKINISILSKIEKKIYAYNTYELNYLNDVYYGKKQIQIMNLYIPFMKQLAKLLRFYKYLNEKKVKINNLKGLFKEIIKGLSEVLFFIFYLYLVQHDGVDLILIFGAKKYVTNIIDLLTCFSDVVADLKVNKVIFDRTKQLFENFNEDKKSVISYTPGNSITVRNLGICLDSKQIFNNLNFSIEESTHKVLLKGKNGSGKSTLSLCLCGIENRFSGVIMMSDAKIGYVPAASFIYNTTVNNNISLWNPGVDNNSMLALLSAIKLDARFNTVRSLLTRIKNDISTGEAQRIGILRALYSSFDIIIFDEPTANIDKENKENTMNLIFDAFKDRKVIVISHEADESEYDQVIDLDRM